VVDVACTSLSHGESFFLPNPGNLTLNTSVSNLGDNPATFTVACSLFTELGGTSYLFYQALTPLPVSGLLPGASQQLSFPSLNLPTNNRYRIRARTMLAGDGNPDNNTRNTETQIYTAPAELRYDDTLYWNAAYALTNNGWAMKFNPHQAGSYNLTQIKVMAQVAAGDSAARVQVLDDNGTAGAPGTILYQTVQVMVSGWNTLALNLPPQTGSFYVAYIFEHGTHTSALRYDDYPASGQDWMMRATISAGAPTPALDVTLTPINPPITVPATGGSFNFNIAALDVGPTQTSFTVWARIKNPNGTYTAPTLGPVTVNPPVGITISRLRTQTVPRPWAPGVYTYLGYANWSFTYPALDSSSFTFTKLADGSGPSVWEAACYGEPFPGEVITMTPQIFSLSEAHPNPFNPTTVLSFELQVSSLVNLKVYDLAGRLMVTLVDGWQEAGSHQVTFDGSKLASGLYFVRMEVGDFTAVHKMMLVK
jgi:hypothetical protein